MSGTEANNNWPEYWPRLVRITPAGRWREPGDRTYLVLRMLGARWSSR